MATAKTAPSPIRLGRYGEQLAAEHLRGLGFIVLARNWRCRAGELDLIATDRTTLVVCEVKTRSGSSFGSPAEAVTTEKAARIRRLAGHWLREQRVRWCRVRFDVIAIYVLPGKPAQLRHLPGAF